MFNSTLGCVWVSNSLMTGSGRCCLSFVQVIGFVDYRLFSALDVSICQLCGRLTRKWTCSGQSVACLCPRPIHYRSWFTWSICHCSTAEANNRDIIQPFKLCIRFIGRSGPLMTDPLMLTHQVSWVCLQSNTQCSKRYNWQTIPDLRALMKGSLLLPLTQRVWMGSFRS